MDDERSSDTAETFGTQDPAGAVSDQNQEEGPAPGTAGSQPDTKDGAEGEGQDTGRERGEQSERSGGAGEHSQATGHPDSAG